MLKLMIVGRRAPGLTRRAAQRHLRDVHGPMVVAAPADAGAMPADYVQNHVVDGIYPPGDHAHAIERDLITELWFDDLAALRESTATPYYLAFLKPDEPRFVDDASVVRLLVQPREIAAAAGGRFKAFILATSGRDATMAAIIEGMRDAAGVRRVVANDVLPPPDGSRRFVDVVVEGWFGECHEAEAAARSVTMIDPTADRSRCLALIAEEFDTDRLRRRSDWPYD